MTDTYNKARKLGINAMNKSISEGRYPYIYNLEDYIKNSKTMGEVSLGEMEIPISMIVGTRNSDRKDAFARNFMPILDERSEFAGKWMKVYEYQMTEGISDPIIAYEYMHRFYVAEGNKRVSVLSYLKSERILANVIRILPERTGEKEIESYYEFVDFYKVTKLYDISFSAPGGYKRLAKRLGLSLDEPWTEEDVRLLKGGFYIFKASYEKKRRKLPVSDAFLIFLEYFDLDWLYNNRSQALEKLLDRLEKEFQTDNYAEAPLYQDNPGEEKTNIIDMVLPGYTLQKPLKIAFLYEAEPNVSSWVYAHESGRESVEEHFAGLVKTFVFEGCDSKDSIATAVKRAVSEGCEVVFSVSPVQLQHILQLAVVYPNVKFLNCSVNITRHSVRSYYGRMYEAKYLMGILAGILNDNHKIGYVADYPIYGNIANINAFALGVAATDPLAEIYLTWMGEKHPQRDEIFWNNQIRIFSGPDNIKPNIYDKDWGLIFVDNGEYKNLALPMCDWGMYYRKIIESILRKTWNAKNLTSSSKPINYWWGMDTGIIDLVLSNRLPGETLSLINSIKKAMVNGVIVPFLGLTHEDIITMNELSHNIVGSIPKYDELSDRGKLLKESNGYIPGEKE